MFYQDQMDCGKGLIIWLPYAGCHLSDSYHKIYLLIESNQKDLCEWIALIDLVPSQNYRYRLKSKHISLISLVDWGEGWEVVIVQGDTRIIMAQFYANIFKVAADFTRPAIDATRSASRANAVDRICDAALHLFFEKISKHWRHLSKEIKRLKRFWLKSLKLDNSFNGTKKQILKT